MIDNDQITALAREYAEEINPVNQLNDYPEAKMIADIMRNALSEATAEQIKDFEGFLRFLLRRFCLVEKSKIGEAYFMVKNKYDNAESPTDMDLALAQKEILDFTFPEIAKEVAPKFHKGDKVVLLSDDGGVYEVEGKTGKHHYALKGVKQDVHEDMLIPYEEPKPAEPFKVGDKMKVYKIGNVYNGAIDEIIDISNCGTCYVLFPDNQAWFRFCDLEPYTEPKEKTCTDDCPSDCPSQNFDDILQDSFLKHNRLHVASMAMAGILANPHLQKAGMDENETAKLSLIMADTLIAEAEKGGEDGKG